MTVLGGRIREQGHGRIDVRRQVVLQSVTIPIQTGDRVPQVLVLIVVSQRAGGSFRKLPPTYVLEVPGRHPVRQALAAEIIDMAAGDDQIQLPIQLAIQKLSSPAQQFVGRPFQARLTLRLDKSPVRLLLE